MNLDKIKSEIQDEIDKAYGDGCRDGLIWAIEALLKEVWETQGDKLHYFQDRINKWFNTAKDKKRK